VHEGFDFLRVPSWPSWFKVFALSADLSFGAYSRIIPASASPAQFASTRRRGRGSLRLPVTAKVAHNSPPIFASATS
jgi:hypothetical protein